ncbi:MAG: class I SAM-dependent methyltransferase [Candidatus Paceibacterota bacterium]
MKEIKILYTKDKFDYELLDTGEGEKLERVGKYTFVRPYEDAFWQKTLSKKEWSEVDGKFWSSQKGAKPGWVFKNKIEKKWEISYKGIKFFVLPTPFRHFGFFAEQASHWDFIEAMIQDQNKDFRNCALGVISPGDPHVSENPCSGLSYKKIKFLNLFGYTGVASLFALRAGAEVTHVDASKQSLAWAKENQILSELEDKPMRIICDDVMKFLDREVKRGNKYDAIIMDPPKFGRGPNGEIWKLEEKLPKLLENIKKILSDKPLFVILTSYATDISALSLGYALKETMKPARNASGIADAGGDLNGKVEVGEMCVLEKSNDRKISLANTAIWVKN